MKKGRGKTKYEYERKYVSDWEEQDISDWFESLGFSPLKEKLFGMVESGEELMEIGDGMSLEEDLKETELPPKEQVMFNMFYNHLRECGDFSLEYDEKKYFNLDYKSTVEKFLKSIPEEKLPDLEVQEASLHCSILCERDHILKYLMEDDLDGEEEVVVKIIITDVYFGLKEGEYLEKNEVVKKEVVPSYRKFGETHAIVWVGPFLIQWSPEEFMIPFKIDPKETDDLIIKTLHDTDAFEINTGKTFNEVKKTIASFVERWNSGFQYSLTPSLWKMIGNEGLFAEQIVEFLGLKEQDLEEIVPWRMDKDSAFFKYLQKMRDKGRCTLSFQPSREFLDCFDVDNYPNVTHIKKMERDNSITLHFPKHKDLDDFVDYIQQKSIIYFPSEFKLLKAFDRIFWIRHFKNPENEIYTPSAPRMEKERWIKKYGKNPSYSTGCPFLNPRELI